MAKLAKCVLIIACCLATSSLVRAGEPDSYLGPKPVRPGAETLLPRDFRTARAAGANYSDTLLTTYLTNAQLGTWAADFVARCGSIARRFSIGKSGNGVDLWVVEISSNPGVVEAKPNFRYVSASVGLHMYAAHWRRPARYGNGQRLSPHAMAGVVAWAVWHGLLS